MDASISQWLAPALDELGRAATFACQPLKVEASHRRFYRITPASGSSCILMQSPPELENNEQFVRLATVFADHEVPVPAILASDAARGLYLMTDLGSRHLEDVYAEGDPQAALRAAITHLLHLQRVTDVAIPPYTRQRFEVELDIFREWFIEAFLELEFPVDTLHRPLGTLVQATAEQPQCCVHRDYHCRNLLFSTSGQFGIVDFQDALIGPVTYDLASLLRDCYHVFSEAEVSYWVDVYLEQSPQQFQREQFAKWLDLTALQRQLKAVGIFARLHLRDGKSSHLPVIMPLLERIVGLAGSYPELEPLTRFLESIAPEAQTRLPGLP